MNKPATSIAEPLNSAQGDLLSYEDIYRAAGIVTPASGYDVSKVVRMLESEHIRALPKDVKRASVLMALDAAGTSVDDLLKDAASHQQALNHYEAGQQDKFAKFESYKAQEETRIQAEMERVAAHYSERMQQIRDQVAREKDALKNWQMAKLQENQRITEVIDLLSKQSVATPAADAPESAAASAAAPHPVLVSKAVAGK